MKILSFDVGIKNLAYCIFDSNQSKILNWDIIDLNVENFTAKVPSGNSSIAKSANDIHITLIKQLDNLPFLLNVDYVVIEKQPSFNPKMRIIGGCLQSYFYIRGVVDNPTITSIEFFSPKHKLKCYIGPPLKLESKVKSKYAQTKKMGVLIAEIKLQEFNETTFKNLFTSSKKKDDLADCYLQAITFCIFKKFCKNDKSCKSDKSCKNDKSIVVEKQKCLTKTQIKQQLKSYLDLNKKVYTVNELFSQPPKNLIQTMENMETNVKDSIKQKYNLELFNEENCTTIFTDLSMIRYLSFYYN